MTRGPWPLYFLPEKGTSSGVGPLRPGACWFAPWLLSPERGLREGDIEELSPEYRATQMSIRPPVIIWLPGVAAWSMDGRASRARTWWTLATPMLAGEDPANWVKRITLSPSVDCSPLYHGHVQNGAITPDCGNREYDERGYLKE